MTLNAAYAAIVHTTQSGSYSAFFPDAPGCYAAGASLEALKADAASALRSHIDVSREEGLAVPPPRSIDAVLADPDVRTDLDSACIILEIRPLARSGAVKRVNLTADEFALDRIDRAAKRLGFTRSAFMVKAALDLAEDSTQAGQSSSSS